MEGKQDLVDAAFEAEAARSAAREARGHAKAARETGSTRR